MTDSMQSAMASTTKTWITFHAPVSPRVHWRRARLFLGAEDTEHTREIHRFVLRGSPAAQPSRATRFEAVNDITALPTRPEEYLLQAADNSTAVSDWEEDVYEVVARACRAAKEEEFEDGMENEFSRELRSLVTGYGNRAIEAMTHLIVYEKVNPEVASETLRSLGSLEDAESYRYRRWLLERALQCSSPVVRDGAALGLAFMDDPHAIEYLRRAVDLERCGELRNDMRLVLEQLENTESCPTS